MPLLLSRSDVETVLTMPHAISAVEEGFRQLALDNVAMPQRTVIRVAPAKGVHLAMPAYLGSEDNPGVLAVKVVTVFPDNPSKHDLPTILGTLLLNDPQTGALMAVMDAGYMTAVRTGAASGVATKYLARDDSRTVGIFGAGAQARTQLEAVCDVRGIERAVVYDPAVETRDRYIKEMSDRLSLTIEPTDDPRSCMENDIVVAATGSKTPIFDGDWIKPGTHLNCVGSHSPDARELDVTAIQRSKVISDYLSACMAEAGDLITPIKEGDYSEDKIHADLGQVIAGTKPGRESAEEITLFKSVGLAIQDATTAAKVYELAREAKVGQEFEI